MGSTESLCTSKAKLTKIALQIPLQEWGDEEVDGVTYSILFERYKPEPEGSGRDGDTVNPGDPQTPGCGYVHYKTRKLRRIKAASLEKLVNHMISLDWASDESYVPCFLATHRAFTSTEEVLQLLLNSYGSNDEIPAANTAEKQRVVRRILNIWIDKYPEDFNQKPEYPCLKSIIEYLERSPLEAEEQRQHASQLLKKFEDEDKERQGDNLEYSTDLASCTFMIKDFLCLPAKEVVEHLTLMEVELFQNLIPSDCMGAIWGKRSKNKTVAPTVSATIEHFNLITRLVTSSILSDTKLTYKTRAKIIQKWIKIAQKCLDLHNISSLKAIMAALQSCPIYRLKNTWAAVKTSRMTTFNELSDLITENNNCKRIRKIMTDRPDQGTVPFIGIYLTDLLMLDTAHKDLYENGCINFYKRRKEYEVISKLGNLQKSCENYRLHPQPRVSSVFGQIHQLTEDESHFNLRNIASTDIERVEFVANGIQPEAKAYLITVKTVEGKEDCCTETLLLEDGNFGGNALEIKLFVRLLS